MSFPASTGILMPSDINLVHHVYSEISAEKWFTRAPERQEQFAAEILDAYRRGMVESDGLTRYCRIVAHEHYGNGGV